MGEKWEVARPWLTPDEFALHSGRIGRCGKTVSVGGEPTGQTARRKMWPSDAFMTYVRKNMEDPRRESEVMLGENRRKKR